MLLLKIIIFALGITFSIFDISSYSKKFGLINNFEARKKSCSRTDLVMRSSFGKVGVKLLGAGLLVLFVLLMIF